VVTIVNRSSNGNPAVAGSKSWLLALGWILVVAGGGLAHVVQTADGVSVQDVRVDLEAGQQLSALLYRPAGATVETPAPGILAVHGYINSRETQSGFAIEFARRGYVVLALDQTGHGFSGGTAFTAGYGGPAGLAYLRRLPFVDPANIGLTGHSMGGWAGLAAAADQPDAYRAIALVGSSTGPGFAPAGTPTFPRNLGVIFPRYDEFARLMWGVPEAAVVGSSDKLRSVFGAVEDVEPQRLYGSKEAGTARWLSTPNTTHPGAHLSVEAIGDTVTWMDRTLAGGTPRPVDDQIWYWKEIGTLVALLGGVFVLLGALAVTLRMPAFRPLVQGGRGAVARPGRSWLGRLAVVSLIPAVTYYPLVGLGAALPANAWLPQGITNQILVWAMGNGLVTLALASLVRRGPFSTETSRLGLALLAALLAVLNLYVAVALSDWLFTTDLRFWVVALKPFAPHHVSAFLAYLLPFTAFFFVTQWAWHSRMSLQAGAAAQYLSAVVAGVGGLAIMLAGAYLYLFTVGRLPPVDPLFTIVAIQFVPVLTLASVISVFAWRRTGRTAPGAFLCGLLVTWYVVAGQATHYVAQP
jgi:pimeloyl-ACP methyl ester carboxylesterase